MQWITEIRGLAASHLKRERDPYRLEKLGEAVRLLEKADAEFANPETDRRVIHEKVTRAMALLGEAGLYGNLQFSENGSKDRGRRKRHPNAS